MGRRGEHMHAGVRSRSKARARALEEHLVRLPTEAIRGNQRQSEAIRCNLVRLPTEGEGRLLLAGGFPCSEGAELRGRRAGHVPEGGRSSGVISFPCSEGAELRGRRAGHVPEGGRSSGVIETSRERASIGRRGRGGAPCRAHTRARGQRGKGARGSPIATGPCRGAADRGPPSRPSCWRAAESEGCPPASRGHQRSSEVVRGQQRSSEVIRGHQGSSEVISGHQRSSEVIIGQQRSSELIRTHQRACPPCPRRAAPAVESSSPRCAARPRSTSRR